ncbi:Protein BPS1, chloroplastic [Quillaja saponaria]|uniref:Protein BPS1, chloroplastic n=1 Tax=Quillaja saponaria TaxID=32244 RepID=A0AAD7PKQ2_QUISA|nr:Protein BPS1, chloroplastic [Quillaja saponaria]
MKTISGKSISSKPISLSKAAKILSKFVSAENGASQAINAYLQRSSASFNELNQLHKELRAPHSKHKRKRPMSKITNNEETIVESPNQNAEFNRDVMQSGNKLRKHLLESDNTINGEENPNHSVVDFGIKPSNGVRDYAGMEGGSEKHKRKKKRKKHDSDSGKNVDNGGGGELGDKEAGFRQGTDAEENLAWSVQSGQDLGHGVEGIDGMESKRKKYKKDKKIKDDSNTFASDKVEVDKEECKGGVGTEDPETQQRKQSNNEKGEKQGLADSVELRSKKRKRSGTKSEGKMDTEQVMTEEKRKHDDVEVRVVDGLDEQRSKKK